MRKTIIGVIAFLLFTVSALKKKEYSLSAEEIVTQHGYLYEEHFVTTEDDYIIRIQRARKPGNQPQGPMYASRAFAVGEHLYFMGGDGSTGLNLIESGYDLWVVGMRGSDGSQGHVSLSVYDNEYWNFDLADQALDHVAAIPYIIDYYNSWDEGTLDGAESWEEKPNYGTQKLHAIGYSQGGGSLANAVALYPDVMNPRIGLIHYISLTVSLAHATSFTLFLNSLTHNFDPFLDQTGVSELATFGNEGLAFLGLAWNLSPETCMRVYSLLIEGNWELNMPSDSFIDVFLTGFGPISSKIQDHWHQSVSSSNWWSHLFDYGTEGNLEVYGQETPPHIPYENHRMPVAMYSSTADTLSTPEDNLWFAEQLGESLISFLQYDGECHMSFGNGEMNQIIDDIREIEEQYPIPVERGEE